MNIYLISQKERQGYDIYDSAIVSAESEDAARMITPDGSEFTCTYWSNWCSGPDKVKVEYIGTGYTGPSHVILASYNAG